MYLYAGNGTFSFNGPAESSIAPGPEITIFSVAAIDPIEMRFKNSIGSIIILPTGVVKIGPALEVTGEMTFTGNVSISGDLTVGSVEVPTIANFHATEFSVGSSSTLTLTGSSLFPIVLSSTILEPIVNNLHEYNGYMTLIGSTNFLLEAPEGTLGVSSGVTG